MLPLAGSEAIDNLDSEEFSSIDQRGVFRDFFPDIGAVEYQGVASERALIWESDWDGDGKLYGVEHALGTHPDLADHQATGNLGISSFDVVGGATLSFGFNAQAKGYTDWVLSRSTSLAPGSFVEVFRYRGPTQSMVLGSGITSQLSGSSFSVIDSTPPSGKAFYHFEAKLIAP